jgi:probable HAF family extracellular repeat protein
LLVTVLVVCSWSIPVAAVGANKPSRACRGDQYTVVELPFLPTVITASGVVAGMTEEHRAALWRRGSGLQELSVPEGFRFTEPVAVKKSGDVVVNALDAQGRKRRSFVYSNRSVIALAGNQTWAHGTGVSGVIVGEWVPAGTTKSDAVYWSSNLPHSIALCCGGILKAVNKAGDMVGDAYDEQGRYHAFVWSPSHGERVIGSSDHFSSAVAINDAGHILIQVAGEAYLDEAGTLRHLELSPKFYNSALGMNNCDSVVGGYGPDSDHYRAFSWTPTAGFRDLNSLISSDSGWTLRSATAINDRGEIVGQGVFERDDRGFLLIPQH